jgi:hypothetical protein
MKTFVIVKLEDMSISTHYESAEKEVYGGPWGDKSTQVNMEVPEGIDYRTHDVTEVIIPEGQTEADITFHHKHEYSDMMGTMTKYFLFVENATKEQAVELENRKAKLFQIRYQRNELLKEADIEIYKLEDDAADTSAWRTYRFQYQLL